MRRRVKHGEFDEASIGAYETSLALLRGRGGGRVSVSSQLMRVLVDVLVETHTPCTPEWAGRFCELDRTHRSALDADVTMGPDERGRLQRLHLQSSFRRRRSSGASTSAGQGTATRACTRYWGITAGTTALLFTWLVRNSGQELGTMHDPESARAYTRKIGRVYFDIQPPPSMMSMMENMMSGMGGGGGGMMPGGMNPAAMMQAMQAM